MDLKEYLSDSLSSISEQVKALIVLASKGQLSQDECKNYFKGDNVMELIKQEYRAFKALHMPNVLEFESRYKEWTSKEEALLLDNLNASWGLVLERVWNSHLLGQN